MLSLALTPAPAQDACSPSGGPASWSPDTGVSLDDSCNTLGSSTPRHRAACQAAELLVLAAEQRQPGVVAWLYHLPGSVTGPPMLESARQLGPRADPSDRERAARVVAEDIDLARSSGIAKLPALYVNDIMLPPVSVPVLMAIVDEELRKEAGENRSQP